jgi:SOS-response transcriptional repressor LexA
VLFTTFVFILQGEEPMEVKQDIASRIRDSRKAIGITIKELAARTKQFSPARIGNWEQGTRNPRPREAKILADILGVSPSYLLCLSDSTKGDLHLHNDFLPRYIPLVELEKIKLTEKELKALIDNLKPYVKDESKIPLDTRAELTAGPLTFATIVTDNSMSPEFKPGDIIIADPDKKPKPGDFVIAEINSNKMIRKYREIGANTEKNSLIELIPLNQDWAASKINNPKEGKILATIISQIKNFTKA